MEESDAFVFGILFFFSAIFLCGVGIAKLAIFYQSIGIISQAYDLEAMSECIVRYGCYCVVIIIIIFTIIFNSNKK